MRAEGAVPATIAIINGVVCVGLSPSEIEELGKLGTGAQKTSRRDVAAVVASVRLDCSSSLSRRYNFATSLVLLAREHGAHAQQGRTGATTVSATMLIAHRVRACALAVPRCVC